MDDFFTYQIELQSSMDEKDLNAMSPLQITAVQVNTNPDRPEAAAKFTIHTDQSGLIGLLRHLHARGLVFLSIRRES